MGAFDPILPDFDLEEWEKKPWAGRLRMACQDWVLHGWGSPLAIHFFYLIKLIFYVWLWSWFCSFSPGIDGLLSIGSWWSEPVAFQKAILFNLLFEVFGLGCSSGPLAGRYNPPIGGAAYFLRPGTIKAPFFPGAPLIGGHRRTVVDVALYVALLAAVVWPLVSPSVEVRMVVPVVVLLFLLGILDTTVFLAARSEHYLTAALCLLFPDWLAGTKWVWGAIWFWAGISKLTRHFPPVIAVMQSTSPMTHFFPGIRKAMFADYPDDLRPSRLATWMAHVGSAVEISIPFLLLFAPSPEVTTAGLVLMVAFHLFITTSVPLGVPIEWNLMMVYGGLFLFGAHPEVSPFDLRSPLLIAYLIGAIFLLQLVGNLVPRKVSFLLSMRYYAGNWAYSVWLFRGNAVERLDEKLKKPALTTRAQLRALGTYDDDTIAAMCTRLPVFRFMHVQGRMLHALLPKATDGDILAYEHYDGEAVASLVVGWAMGDGHMHHEQLLAAVQAECGFAPGELRCIFVESQPLHRPFCAYRIVDAVTGVVDSGEVAVADLMPLNAWPEGT